MSRRFGGRARQALVAAGLALSVIPLVARPAAAAPPPTPSLEGGAFGTWLNQINLGSPYGTFNNNPTPQVVTPPGGGIATNFSGPLTFGGMAPLYTPFISVGPSGAATAGAISNNLPEVDSQAAICSPNNNMNLNNNGFTWPVTATGGECGGGAGGKQTNTSSLDIELAGLSVKVNKLTSACYAQDSTNPNQVAASAFVGSLTINGQSMPAGQVPPNTKYVETYTVGTGSSTSTATLTLVFNEQVPGLSNPPPNAFKGVLVNGLHIYVGSPPSPYANTDSAMFSESRCEVATVPTPPGIIPEAPLAAEIPISAAVLGGGAILLIRTRRRRRRLA
jgi:hypothetical protein